MKVPSTTGERTGPGLARLRHPQTRRGAFTAASRRRTAPPPDVLTGGVELLLQLALALDALE